MSRSIYFKNGEEREVKTIYCLGRNFAEHTKEMKADLNDKPIIFIKPATAIPKPEEMVSSVELPYYSNNVHHEVEIVIIIKSDGYKINRNEAFDYIDGIGIGLDLTLRDLQEKAKSKAHPWAVSKGFKNSAPISQFLKLENGKIQDTDFDTSNLNFKLKVNDAIRQIGHTKDMILDIPAIVEYISSIFELQAGDLIFTGTPKGVDQIATGDIAYCEIENIINFTVNFR